MTRHLLIDSDDVIKHIGDHTRWQILIFVITAIGGLHQFCTQNLIFVYIGSTTKCDKYWFDEPERRNQTLAPDWNLVCDKSYLVPIAQSICVVGIMVGSPVWSTLSDYFGRKKVFMICHVLTLIFGCCAAFSPSIFVFMILRFLSGFSVVGCLIGQVIALELFPTKYRVIVGTMMQYGWQFGAAVLVVLGYFIREWRLLLLISTCLGSIPVLLCYFIVPESFLWLITNSRTNEAQRILYQARRINGDKAKPPADTLFETDELVRDTRAMTVSMKSIHSDDSNMPESEKLRHADAQTDICSGVEFEDDHMGTSLVRHVFKSEIMRRISLVLGLNWALAALTYYAMSFAAGGLAGDFYLNTLLLLLVEFPPIAIGTYVMKRFGRRPTQMMYIGGAGVLIALTIPLRRLLLPSAVVTTFIIISKFFSTGAFVAVILITPESYPTNLRGFGYGLGNAAARIGGLLGPFYNFAQERIWWLPAAITSCLAILAALSNLALVETKGRALPTAIEEIENWYAPHKRNRKPSPK